MDSLNEADPSLIPPAPPRSVPGIAQSCGLCAVFVALLIPINIAFELLDRFARLPLDMFTRLLIMQVIAWPVTIWIGLSWANVTLREACPLRSFPVRIVPALLIASFGLTILLLEVTGWIPMPESIRKQLSQQAESSSKLAMFLSAVVMAPVAEEFLFRGLMLRGYLGRYSVKKAVWASSIVFALFHLNPWQAVVALPTGLGLAWLFLRTGSLIPCILGHMMVNFSASFLLAPLGLVLGYNAEALKALNHFPLSMLAVAGAMAIIGVIILWRQLASLSQSTDASPE
jgi:membrane protease YdiL (CAAX protease family)